MQESDPGPPPFPPNGPSEQTAISPPSFPAQSSSVLPVQPPSHSPLVSDEAKRNIISHSTSGAQVIVTPAPPAGFIKMESAVGLWNPNVAAETKEPLVGYVIEPVHLGDDGGRPMVAFLFKLTAPTTCLDPRDKPYRARIDEEILVPDLGYQFEPWARYALNPEYVYQIWAIVAGRRTYVERPSVWVFDWYTFNQPKPRIEIHPKSAAKFRRPQQ
jgi:hypothetical protein